MGGSIQQQHPGVVQMQFQSSGDTLFKELFKETAEALQQAFAVLEEGIAASRAQVTPHHVYGFFWPNCILSPTAEGLS